MSLYPTGENAQNNNCHYTQLAKIHNGYYILILAIDYIGNKNPYVPTYIVLFLQILDIQACLSKNHFEAYFFVFRCFQTVEYEADQDGYKPRISYEDTGAGAGYDANSQSQGQGGYSGGY